MPSDSDCEASEQVVPGTTPSQQQQQQQRRRQHTQFRHSSGSSMDSLGPVVPCSPSHRQPCKRGAVSSLRLVLVTQDHAR